MEVNGCKHYPQEKIQMNVMTSCEKENMAGKMKGCKDYPQEKLTGKKGN
jgi:hypothetical protein